MTWPAPSLGSSSHPLELGATIGRLIELNPAIVVPGHGPVQHDTAYLQLTQRLLASFKRQIEASVARGDSIEEARRAMRLDDIKREFVRDSSLLSYLFDSYVLSSGVPAAFRDSRRPIPIAR